MDQQITVSLQDVYDVCKIICAVPAPACEMTKVRDEAVMDVYTLLEQLAMERATEKRDG